MSKSFTPDSRLVANIVPSSNFNNRKGGETAKLIIIHYTGMKTARDALERLCDPKAEVSCHYFIDETGEISQLVREENRAWHAGKANWRGKEDINSSSIGIEIVNPGHEFGYVDFPQPQIDAVVELIEDIVKRNQISNDAIIAHSDIAPLRKEDPGEKFPWEYLATKGIGEWVPPRPIGNELPSAAQLGREEILLWQNQLAEYGFGIALTGQYDQLTRACTTAFQRRYRQQLVDGNADQSTIATMKDLLNARQ